MRCIGVYENSALLQSILSSSTSHHPIEHWAREMGISCLALIAVLMFPRYVAQVDLFHGLRLTRRSSLAFVTFKNNVMVLSLRAMMVQFVVLMGIAAFCFGGFLYALWT